MKQLYEARQADNLLGPQERSWEKFLSSCQVRCVNRKVELSGQQLGVGAAKVIAEMIKWNQKISRMNLSSNKISGTGLDILAL